jgi:hypothetical protein
MRRLLALLVLATGCGSTVATTTTMQLPGGGSFAPGSVDAGSVGHAPPSLVGTAGQGGNAAGGSTNGSTTPGTSGIPTGTGATALGSPYKGVTPTSIYVGVSYAAATGSGTGEQVGAALSVGGFSSVNERPLIDAMIKDVNARGGVLGRKLVPVYATYDPADTRPYDQQSQATCATFNEDHQVFAHIAAVSHPSFFSCMEKAGTVGIERRSAGSDALDRQFPGVFITSDLDYTRASAQLVRSLVAQGFLTKTSRVGILQVDTPDFDRVRTVGIEPELRAAGVPAAEVYRTAPVEGAASASLTIRDAQAAVLRFASTGVDRVLFAHPYGALLDLSFMRQAEQQGYHPKYGLSSHDGPVAMSKGNAAPAQLAGARGLGFQIFDDFSDPPSSQVSPAVDDCLRPFLRAGLKPPADRGQLNQYLTYCASIRLFVQLATKAGPHLTRTSFITAGSTLGRVTNDPFAIGGEALRTGGQRGGVSVLQPIQYDGPCDCFRPAGPVERLS